MNSLETNLRLIKQEKDEKILPENIKTGVQILGVTGTLETGIDTSDATATVNDMTEGKTAYVNGEKITGAIPEITPYTGVLTLNQKGIGSDGDGTIGYLNSDVDKDTIVRKGTNVAIMADNAKIADMIGLTADKIVKGNSFLGIEGTAEAGGTATEGVKLFETEEEMQADTTAQEGDLAIIYRNITTPMSEGITTDRLGYPNRVTLDTAVSSSQGSAISATGGEIAVSGSASFNASNISIQINDVTVTYSSEDSLNWIKTSGPHTQAFDSPVTFTAVWADEIWPVIGYFMLKQDLYQDGLYEYNGTSWEVAPNQFTLITNTHLMKDLIAYGRDGVVVGEFEGGAKVYSDKQTLLDTYGEPVGDLGLVYTDKEYPLQQKSAFQKVKFNSTVTFSEDVREKYFNFGNVDDWESGFQIQMGTNFMDIQANNYSFMIHYSTSDGITFTTTKDVSGWYEFNSPVSSRGDWDDGLSQLMSIQMKSFEGLYQVGEGYDPYATYVLDFSQSPTVTKKEDRIIRQSDIQGVLDLIDFDSKGLDAVEIYYDGTYYYAMCASNSGAFMTIRDTSTNTVYWTAWDSSNYQYEENRPLYKIDLANNTIISTTLFTSIATSENLVATTSYDKTGYYKLAEVALNENTYIIDYLKTAEHHLESEWAIWRVTSYGGTVGGNDSYPLDNLRVPVTRYFIAPTQFSTEAEYVYGDTIFYGTAGPDVGTLQKTNNLTKDELKLRVDIYNSFHNLSLDTSTKDLTGAFRDYQGDVLPNIDTSNVTNMTYMFEDAINLTSIPLLDTGKVESMAYMFHGCNNLSVVPLLDTKNVVEMTAMFSGCINLTVAPEFNTAKVTNMINIFYNCASLVDVPLYDTSATTNLIVAFGSCPSLSEDSLNNILLMCANSAVTNATYKTLKSVGLTQEQATKCTTLSNYSVFTTAGWTTGY